MVNPTETRCIPRIERDRLMFDEEDTRTPILFFPDYPANPGMIVCYAHLDQHSEASLAYYRETSPMTNRDLALTVPLLAEYRGRMREANDEGELRVIFRRPSKTR